MPMKGEKAIQYRKRYYQEHKTRMDAYNKAWKKAHPLTVSDYQAKYYRQRKQRERREKQKEESA